MIMMSILKRVDFDLPYSYYTPIQIMPTTYSTI